LQAKRSTRRAGRGPSPKHPVIRIGISSCLLGEAVRWDGGHRRDGLIADLLSRYVHFVPVCPEMEAGMGVPREAVRLVGAAQAPRMVGVVSGRDWTATLRAYARVRVRRLARLDLSGYLLKKDSPSCGMTKVRVHSGKGRASRKGVGLFARELQRHLPLLPLEQEDRLHDAALREHFIERVLAYRRLKDLLDSSCRCNDLVAFHSDHELLLLAHGRGHCRGLERLTAPGTRPRWPSPGKMYADRFMAVLRVRATVAGHGNAMQRAARFLEDHLGAGEKRELRKAMADYRKSRAPRSVPLALLRRHARRQDVAYLQRQIYLHPHPLELKLLNHA